MFPSISGLVVHQVRSWKQPWIYSTCLTLPKLNYVQVLNSWSDLPNTLRQPASVGLVQSASQSSLSVRTSKRPCSFCWLNVCHSDSKDNARISPAFSLVHIAGVSEPRCLLPNPGSNLVSTHVFPFPSTIPPLLYARLFSPSGFSC